MKSVINSNTERSLYQIAPVTQPKKAPAPTLLTPIIATLFRDAKQWHLFKIMVLSTVFCVALVIIRMYQAKFNPFALNGIEEWKSTRGAYGSFFFLIWNLFLAWIPYWFSLALDFFTRFRSTPSVFSLSFLLAGWLLFFPNAPYIVTDLLHLKNREIVPHWYDLMLIVSFAWTGLLLGYISLFEIQRFLEKRLSKPWVWSILITAIWLAGFGVYMGRFQRWNSWDILTRPWAIIAQQLHVLSHPMPYIDTLGVAFVMSGFLFVGYLTLNALRSQTA